MTRKPPTTEEKLNQAADRTISGDNLAKEHGTAAKPLSFYPMKLEAAVAALLKIKPEPKAKPEES